MLSVKTLVCESYICIKYNVLTVYEEDACEKLGLSAWRFSSQSIHNERNDKKNNKDIEKYLCNPCSRASDSCETKHSSYDSYNEKYERPS